MCASERVLFERPWRAPRMVGDENARDYPSSTSTADSSLALDTLPELEKFVDVDETVLADDYTDDVAGSSELEITAKYCRDCHVTTQRLYHVAALSRVCASLEDEHSFPIDLITELAEDDDNDVRRSIAMQIDAFASCLMRLSDKLDQFNAIKLLGVMFMLVEDDCDEVIQAAEHSCSAVAVLLSREKQRSLLLSTLHTFGESEEEEIRMSAARIFGSLSRVLGEEITKSDVLPNLLKLTADKEFQVRQAVASALCETIEALDGNDALCLVLPAFLRLSKDHVWAVRAACAKHIVKLIRAIPQDQVLAIASETFEQLANDVSFNVRTAAFEQLGPLIFELGPLNVPTIFVDYFTSMAESLTSNSALQQSCAYNLPGVALALTEPRWSELCPAFRLLATSLNWRVRRTLGCSLHEVAKIIGRDNTEKDLLPVLEKFLEDTDEVKIGVVNHLAETMSIVGSASRLSLCRLLATFNSQETEKIGNWRIRFALAEQLLPLTSLLSGAAAAEFIVPILLLYLDDTAAVVREKAIEVVGKVLAHATHDLSWYSEPIVNALASIKLLATSHRWSDRRAYVNVSLALVKEVEQRFVVDEMMPLLVMLAEDSVIAVKLALSNLLVETLAFDPTYSSLPDFCAALHILQADEGLRAAKIVHRAATQAHDTREQLDEGFTPSRDVIFAPTGL